MFVLDNSGSMAWNYLPDYVSAGSGGTGSNICWNGTSDSSSRAQCSGNGPGNNSSTVDVPLASSDINYIYYNPNIRYLPPLKADGTSYASASTTAACSDGFAASGCTMNFVNGTTVSGATISSTTVIGSTTVTVPSSQGLVGAWVTGTGVPANTYVTAAADATHISLSQAATTSATNSLTYKTGAYPHQVYCNTGSPTDQDKRGDATGSGPVCKENGNTTGNNLYPLSTFTTSNNYNGVPYYYTMSPLEYCTNSFLTDCKYAADGTHTVAANYRWCNAYSNVSNTPTYTDCQDQRDLTHTIPDYLGGTQSSTAAVAATTKLTVNSYTVGKSINDIKINGVSIVDPTTNIVAGSGGLTSTTLLAQAICTAIHGKFLADGSPTTTNHYDCPTAPATATLTIVAAKAEAAPNGWPVVVTSTSASTAGSTASGTITFNTAGATVINDITVAGVSVLTSKPRYFADGTTTATVASTLAGFIGNGYSGSTTGTNVLTITSNTIGANTGAIAVTSTAIAAKATLTANSAVGTSGGAIGNITVNGTIIENSQTFAASATTTTVATQIKNGPLLNGFTATSATNVATITAPAGNASNGYQIAVGVGSVAGTAVTGSLNITNSGAIKVTGLTVGLHALIAPGSLPYYFGPTATSTNVCSGLSSLVNAYTATSGFSSSCTGAQLNLTGPSSITYNGAAITLAGSAVAGVGTYPVGYITFSGTSSSSTSASLTLTVLGNTASVGVGSIVASASAISIGKSKNSSTAASTVNSAIGTAGTIKAYLGNAAAIAGAATGVCPNSASVVCLVDTTAYTNTVSAVTAGTGGLNGTLAAVLTGTSGGSAPPAATNPATGNTTATANAAYAAPTNTGTMNGNGVASIPDYSGSLTKGTFPAAAGGAAATANAGYAAQSYAIGGSGALSGGTAATGPIDTNATAPSTLVMGTGGGGVNGVDGVSAGRALVGKFNRVDIIPSVNSYPASGTKGIERTDCAGTTCSYNEELQNFANWYTYYRFRLLMMKSAVTHAFSPLDEKYRVGFDLLSHYSASDVDLHVAQFVDNGEVANQRTNWWSKLTTATTSGSTPLRSSLRKQGRYYAGNLTTGAATPAVAETKAKGTITISAAKNGDTITSIKVEGVELLGVVHTVSECTGTTACTSAQRTTLAANLVTKINAYITGGGGATYNSFNSCKGNDGVTTVTCAVYVATSSGNTITITAPAVTTATDPSLPTVLGQGTYFNGNPLSMVKSGTLTFSKVDMGGGVDSHPMIPAAVSEPIQYSCQQNYTIMVTDGYWNSDSYADLKQLDGTTQIGNQDNDATATPRPYYDGAQPSTTCTDSTFSSCGTLSDVAMYFYKTDLRDSTLGNATSSATGQNVAENNVFTSPTDNNAKQHMTFFAMGLGQPGTLRFRSDYLTANSGDFNDILSGTKNWPAPTLNSPTTIDDLWHATVNGHGKFFSARDPSTVGAGLSEALAQIKVRVGSAAAAATSNLMPVPGDNFAYVASYATVDWWGDLQARNIDLTTGAVSDPANAAPNECVSDSGCPWSAQKKLDTLVSGSGWSTTRKVFIAPSVPTFTGGDTMRPFTTGTGGLTAAEITAYFNPNTLSQYALDAVSYPTYIKPDNGTTDFGSTNLVNYLRGDRSLEANGTNNPGIWRARSHALGDIVNTQPVYVKAPAFTYTDGGYAAWAADTRRKDRPSVVYVSANDGMLHAFAAQDFTATTDYPANLVGGAELWSFIPTQALHAIKGLADVAYTHRYYVDGPITVGDANFGGGDSDWHTILIGGLGGGGTAYYALDITNPTDPKYLWEIDNATTGFTNLGYTFGNPSINKLPNGEWAVFFSSGYNNADGHGHLYAVDPKTGALKSGFPLTTTGDSGTIASPSNLGKISSWVDNLLVSNMATYIYGGDMNGNLWRFDLAPSAVGHTGSSVFKLAHLADGASPTPHAQPITTRPELTQVGDTRVVYVGTGQYLAIADLTDTNVQSFYAIKDTLNQPDALGHYNLGGGAESTWNPRTDTGTVAGVANTPLFLVRKLIEQKDDGSQITKTDPLSQKTTNAREICSGASSTVDHVSNKCANETGGTMDWSNYGGWYIDLPDAGERINVDMNLSLGTLTFGSNVPASNACTSGGFGWLNYVDFKSGLNAENTDLLVSEQISNALIVGVNVVKLPGNVLAAIVTTSDNQHVTMSPSFTPDVFKGQRNLWREFQPY
jgi:type IV pilus assembly protein PilY1